MQKQDREYSKLIGSRIMEARKYSNLTQGQLALACGVEEKTIQSIEKGRRRPSYELIAAISEETNVLVDFFLKGGSKISTTYIMEEYAQRINRMNTQTKQAGLNMMDNLLELQEKNEKEAAQ